MAGLTATAAAALVVGTLVSSYFAAEANDRAVAASNAEVVAQTQKGIADDNAKRARNALEATERQLRISTAERLAGVALATRTSDADLSLSLAVESGRTTQSAREGLLISSHQALLDCLLSTSGRALALHQGQVSGAAISPNGRWLVTAIDQRAQLWDLAAMDPATQPLALHYGAINTLTISSDSRWLAAAEGNTVRVWDLTAEDPGDSAAILSGHQNAITSLTISPNSRLIITYSSDKTKVWDLIAKDPATTSFTLAGQQWPIRSMAISRDGRWLVTAILDERKVKGTQSRGGANGWERYVESVGWLRDPQKEGTCAIWDLSATDTDSSSRLLSKDIGHNSTPVERVAISSDGRWIAGGSDRYIKLWDVDGDGTAAEPLILTIDCLDALTGQSKDYRRIVQADNRWLGEFLSISPNSRWLVANPAGTGRLGIYIWDLGEVKRSQTPRVVPGGGNDAGSDDHIAISPDSRWLVWASHSGTALRIYDLETGGLDSVVEVGVFVRGVAISPDSKWLLIGASDKTAMLVDLNAANPSLSPLILSDHPEGVEGVSFSSDGRWIMTSSHDGTARLWRWQWDDLVHIAADVGRNLTHEEWRRFFPGKPYHKTFPDLPTP